MAVARSEPDIVTVVLTLAQRRSAGHGIRAVVIQLGDLQKIARVRRAAENDFAAVAAGQGDFIRGGIVAGGDFVVRRGSDFVENILQRIRGRDGDLRAVHRERPRRDRRGKSRRADGHAACVATRRENLADVARAVDLGGGGQLRNIESKIAGRSVVRRLPPWPPRNWKIAPRCFGKVSGPAMPANPSATLLKSLAMVVKADFWVLRAVCWLCHCVSGVRSACASSVTMFCQFIPEASPDMARVDDRLELVLFVKPICGTWLVLKIELMVLAA